MQITIYYVLIPTPELVAAAEEATQTWLVEPDVWITTEHHGVKARLEEEVKAAAWTLFLAKLAPDHQETERHKIFRLKCLRLGFPGCWKLIVSRSGDPVDHLFDEARANKALALQALRDAGV